MTIIMYDNIKSCIIMNNSKQVFYYVIVSCAMII